MKLQDFKNKRVTVMGIGLHGGGLGAINFLYQNGAQIIATDLRSKKDLKESLDALKNFTNIKYVLGQHQEQDFIKTDLVIKNPAVPKDSKFLKIARDHGVPIETDIGIFFDLCPGTIIGVTGTRGKSTTASLIYQLLKAKHPDTILAGNIRMSVLEKLNEIKKTTLVVLELSSWQLNGLAEHHKSPPVAVMTNILPDHLNRYHSIKEYIADKKIIYKFQTSKNFLVLNYDDKNLKHLASEAKSRIYYYSTEPRAMVELENMPKTNQDIRIGAHLAGGKIFLGASKEKIIQATDIKLFGQHNLSHVLAAVTVAKLFNVPSRTIEKTLKEFPGLQGRLELIKEVNGVKYINDTTATIPEATIAAIEAVTNGYLSGTGRLILIAGGADKNLIFENLARLIYQKVKAVLLLNGTATPKLEKEIKKQMAANHRQPPPHKPQPEPIIKNLNDLKSAVFFAEKVARPGDAVLLSPACASFGLFRHEFERGDRFNEIVNQLT